MPIRVSLLCRCVLISAFSLAAHLAAQQNTGSIQGMVTDPSGAAVTGAAVSAKPPTGSVLQTVSELQPTLLLRKSGATIILVFLAERFVLRRIETAGRWLD
jgi:hypothetical protein